MSKILVVDDDHNMREFLEIMLVREGHEVATAAEAARAVKLCKKEDFDLIITDLRMPKMDGIELLKEIKEISPEAMVILITAYASGETAVSAMKEGAFDYIEKDFKVEELKKTIADALAKKGVKKNDVIFRKGVEEDLGFGRMIGKSREMLKIYSVITKVAVTTANVLILGESGTGKELVARAIHEQSPRCKKPFVVINCGGIPENLLESELFGHMKGSFTGAYADKAGLFEVAKEGTIFLDELAELPPALQVKLLRVVQEKTFRRIGGAEDIKVDTRIISATNQQLEKRVKDGRFREDLYYRLNVIPIHVPPLRERKEDIPLLTKHFIGKYSTEFGKEIKTISSYAMELLMDYQFPGNIRELENIIERSIALETSSIILPENLILSSDLSGETGVSLGGEITEQTDLNEELAKIERRFIEGALKKTGGSKTKAAELLHVTLDSLHYRIKKLHLED